MKSNLKTEEKYPLLYLIVDKDNGGSKNNKKFHERRSGITSGAANVLEQWPGYLSTCWVSSLVILVVFSIIILLTTALSSYKFHHIPRCIAGDNPMLDNNTIHLVHGPENWNQHQLDMVEKIIEIFPNHRVHLVLIKRQTYSETFEDNNPNTQKLQQETTAISSRTSSVTSSTNTAASRKILRLLEEPILDKSSSNNNIFNKDDTLANELNKDSLFGWPFFNPRDFVNSFLRRSLSKNRRSLLRRRYTTAKPKKVTDIASLLLRYPSIFTEVLTYEEIFKKTPLFLTWHRLNDETKIFAIRVLQLWQYGGLSFDLIQMKNMSEEYYYSSVSPENLMVTTETYNAIIKNNTSNTTHTEAENELEKPNTYVDSLLYLGHSNFQMIPGGIVTLAENGCHMETKSPCHSFFGEVLFNLRNANMYTTPETIIKSALEYFLKPTHKKL